MAVDLSGCRAKLTRARFHFAALEADFLGWTAALPPEHTVGIGRYREPETGSLRFVVTNAPEAPQHRWGVYLGDVVHNLRSALDHLAYALADDYRPNRGEDKDTQFPICSSVANFQQSASRLKHIGPMHRAMIEDLQPYQAPDGYADHPLGLLHELSNTDKHRLIHVVLLAADLHSLMYAGAGYQLVNADIEDVLEQTFSEQPVIPGAVLMTAQIRKKDPAGPEADMQLILPHGVGLNLALGPGRLLKYVGPNLLAATEKVINDFHR